MTPPLAAHIAALLQRVACEGLIDDIARLELRFAEAEDAGLRFEIAKLPGFFWLRRGDNARATAGMTMAHGHGADRGAACFTGGPTVTVRPR